ncbi:MAG: ribbon-helix-helix protein, CopG family [Dehalococcoidales bacterium]
MRKITKITISLPEEVLSAVERERERNGESLDEFFRYAAEMLLAYRREQEMINQY